MKLYPLPLLNTYNGTDTYDLIHSQFIVILLHNLTYTVKINIEMIIKI